MFLIDFQDAYFKIPIHQSPSLTYVLLWKGKSASLRLFALVFPQHPMSLLVFALISEWGNRRGIQLLCYISD